MQEQRQYLWETDQIYNAENLADEFTEVEITGEITLSNLKELSMDLDGELCGSLRSVLSRYGLELSKKWAEDTLRCDNRTLSAELIQITDYICLSIDGWCKEGVALDIVFREADSMKPQVAVCNQNHRGVPKREFYQFGDDIWIATTEEGITGSNYSQFVSIWYSTKDREEKLCYIASESEGISETDHSYTTYGFDTDTPEVCEDAEGEFQIILPIKVTLEANYYDENWDITPWKTSLSKETTIQFGYDDMRGEFYISDAPYGYFLTNPGLTAEILRDMFSEEICSIQTENPYWNPWKAIYAE